MESIYSQMNKIDDKESLNEKYNVRTLRDVKKLHEAAAPRSDRSSIKTRVNELIDMVDWSKWEKFTSTGDDTEPEVKRTKAIDDGIRVDVYLGWDYGRHGDDFQEYVKATNEKFEAFAAIVRKQEPSWSVKLVKSHGSRGVTWTNYWAQVTAKNSIKEGVDTDNSMRKLQDAADSVKCKLTPGFIEYATEDPEMLDDAIEDELLYCGETLCNEFPEMIGWEFGEDDELTDKYGSYCVVDTGTDEGRILVQIDGHGRIYNLE